MTATTRITLFLLAAAGPVLLVLLPLGAFMLNSLYSMSNGQIHQDLSFGNYIEFATNWTYLGVLLSTIWLGVRVSGFASYWPIRSPGLSGSSRNSGVFRCFGDHPALVHELYRQALHHALAAGRQGAGERGAGGHGHS